jgi:molybdopterin-guanine dinucleotide biosynthesis protein A
MTTRSLNETLAVIFCGGQQRRFGRLSGRHAKTLALAYDTPLLWRLCDQLQEGGLTRIVACTTPAFGGQIRDSLDQYAGSMANAAEIEVVVSEAQQRGVVHGLRDVLHALPADRCLSCLGDIFFASNPFPGALSDDDGDAIGTASCRGDSDWRLGGLVHAVDGRVEAFIERPDARPTVPVRRWSGLVVSARRRAMTDLDVFIRQAPPDAPLGDFLEFQRARGCSFRVVDGPDFVNVNTPDDLLLASLRARLAAEGHTPPSPLTEALLAAAERLRRGASQGEP